MMRTPARHWLLKSIRVTTRSGSPWTPLRTAPASAPMRLLLIEDDPPAAQPAAALQRPDPRGASAATAARPGAMAAGPSRGGGAGPPAARAGRPEVPGRRAGAGLTHRCWILTARGTGRRPGAGPQRRRRRLPGQALRPGRTGGPHPALHRRSGAAAAEQDAPRWGALRLDPASGAFHHGTGAGTHAARAAHCCIGALSRRAGPRGYHEQLLDAVFEGEAETLPEAIEVVGVPAAQEAGRTGATIMTLRGGLPAEG